MYFCSHLGFNVFGILSLAVSLLAGLPGILCLFQVHVFFYRNGDDLPGLSSLVRLRSPWSNNAQQLGQEHSLLYLHRALTIYCVWCALEPSPMIPPNTLKKQRWVLSTQLRYALYLVGDGWEHPRTPSM